MEYFRNYLTIGSWKRDLEKTKQDFSRLYSRRSELSDIVRSERGSIRTALMLGISGLTIAAFGGRITDDYGLYLEIGGLLFCLAGLVYGMISDKPNEDGR